MNLVIAGSKVEADKWLHSRGLPNNRFSYLESGLQVEANSLGTVVILVGRFNENKAYDYIVKNGLDKVRFLLVKEA